uniref:La-related protein 6 n=1 Tax=Schistocephalus solidus TaxID=70667 RepID=A0A0V0JBP0_SCHSO
MTKLLRNWVSTGQSVTGGHMMEVVGGSVEDAGSRHSAPKPVKNLWIRGGQSPDSEPLEAFSNHQPTNECASSPPGDNLSAKILRQIEFYFSDANILKDQFMLKSVKASKEGWMKLSTVAAFKRILSLTTNEQDVRDALKNSSQVEVSDDGTLIRRKNPLPAWDRLVYTRTIMISSFDPGEVVSVDSITALFESVGIPVSLVRVIDAGRSVPHDLVKSQSIHGYLGSELCAVVEFETRELAHQAISFVRSLWPNCYSVILSYNPNKANTAKVKADKPREKRKEKNAQPETPPERPQITLTRSGGEGGKVTLIREPRFPPTEESKGFDSGWRELLRLQRLLLNAPDLPEVEPFVVSSSPPSRIVPPVVAGKSPPQVPLDQQQPHQSLMMLDEAIVCVTASVPPTSNGHQ